MNAETMRHYCRNPHCRTKLAEPVESPKQAFCTSGCHGSFFRLRCVVCERALPRGPANRRHCKRSECRADYRRFPHLYTFKKAETGTKIRTVQRPSKTPIKSGVKTAPEAPNPSWLRLAKLPLDPDIKARVDRANEPERIRRETAWCPRPAPVFGPDTPPLNVLGGYRFPDAPKLFGIKRSIKRRAVTDPAVSDEPWAIPAFLRRST